MFWLKEDQQLTIFVAVVAFNEPYLIQTVESAMGKATYPERIYFGIIEHRTDGCFTDLSMYHNIKHIQINYNAPLGLGVPRTFVLQLYDNQDFILQIDAHMIFNQDWDSRLIRNYQMISKETEEDKIVITSRPHWWAVNQKNEIHFSGVNDGMTTLTYRIKMFITCITHDELVAIKNDHKRNGFFYVKYSPNSYVAFSRSSHKFNEVTLQSLQEVEEWLSVEHALVFQYPEYTGNVWHPIDDTEYAEHHLFSAHFVFATSKFFYDIVLDPRIQFGGEEQTMAMRGWTRGFRFFSIRDHILWHLNKAGTVNYSLDRMNNPGDSNLNAHYFRRLDQSMQHVEQVLTGATLGDWGAPNIDKLREYEQVIGFSFQKFYNMKKNNP